MVLVGFLNVCFLYSFTFSPHKEPLTRKLKRVDVAGAILIIATVASLLIGFDHGSNESWSSSATQGCLLASIAFFAAFFYVEIRVAVEPFAPASVLLNRPLAACLVSGFFIYGAWFGMLYHLPLYWQAVEGLSASQASLRLLPGVVTGVLGSLLAGVVRTLTHPCTHSFEGRGEKLTDRWRLLRERGVTTVSLSSRTRSWYSALSF